MSGWTSINSFSTSTRDVIVQSGAISFTNFENLRVTIDNSGSGQFSLGNRNLIYKNAEQWVFEQGSYIISAGDFERILEFRGGASATVSGGGGDDLFWLERVGDGRGDINLLITDFNPDIDLINVSGFGYESDFNEAFALERNISVLHLGSGVNSQTEVDIRSKSSDGRAKLFVNGHVDLDFIDYEPGRGFIAHFKTAERLNHGGEVVASPLPDTTRAPEATLRAPAGQSKIAFSEPVSSAVISQDSSGSWTVTLPGGSSNRLEGYKRVEFTDKTVALDTEAVGGQAYRVYKAAFNREPDQGGLGYWIAQMDSGMNMVEVAARFIDSNEFRSIYGNNPSDAVFLTRVYQNVLGREPEPTGYNWWLNELRTNPEKTRAKVLADFSESAENKVGVSSLISAGVVFQPYTSKEYRVVSRAAEVNEGQTAVFDVSTVNVAAGTQLAYTITGVSATDIVGGQLSGTINVGSNGRATISIPIAADNLTEGRETLQVNLQGQSASVVINDTSRAQVANPTYSLTASTVSVNEGASAVLTLLTTQVAAGTSFSYLLSGIQAADIVGGQLSGTVTVNAQGQATLSIPIAADNLTEGPEVLTAAIRSPQGSTLASSSVVINDTSVTIVGISDGGDSGGGGGGGGGG